jgi:hypothetical protein
MRRGIDQAVKLAQLERRLHEIDCELTIEAQLSWVRRRRKAGLRADVASMPPLEQLVGRRIAGEIAARTAAARTRKVNQAVARDPRLATMQARVWAEGKGGLVRQGGHVTRVV